MELTGLHHVTAVTGRAAENVAFYTDVLGLRLVKKTVNQDDVSAYHLFYGDALGNPGTELTFFDWPRLPPSVPGAGTISATALRVTGAAAIEYWARRLSDHGLTPTARTEPGQPSALAFQDPEGQHLELVDDGGAPGGAPWPGSPVPAEFALRGLHGVTLTVDRLEPTAWILTEVLGFRRASDGSPDGAAGRTAGRGARFETGPGGPGAEVRVEARPEAAPGVVGPGGVHHVAFRVPDAEAQLRWRERIAAARVPVTPVVERYYFKSIYFREPGGVLFEIATDGPGFATDEDPAHLGERLALPPFLEPDRAEIEAGLRPLPTGPASRARR
jgi:glyoxalase family protein